MVTSSLHVLVREEDREELLMITSVQEVGDCPGMWRKATQSGVSFCRVANNGKYTCSSASFSINGISYQRVRVRARFYQKKWT